MTDGPNVSQPTAIVVGAGLSGLIAAQDLLAAGWSVSVLEAADRPGGRLVPDQPHPADGFLRECGFPLFPEPWPSLARHLDSATLGMRAFDSDILIWNGTRRVPLNVRIGHTRPSAILSLADSVRLTRWAWEVRGADWYSVAEAACEPGVDRSALEGLRARGFSESFIDTIARPVLGGLMLDRSLMTSEGVMHFTFRTLVMGTLAIPADGTGAIPDVLATRLPEGTIVTGLRVDSLIHEGMRVVGVRSTTGEQRADAVIVATDPPTARALTGIETIPTRRIGATSVLLAAPDGPETRALGNHLLFDGTGGAHGTQTVSHLVPLSAIQPLAVPPKQCLLAAIVLEGSNAHPPGFAEAVIEDARRLSGIPALEVVGIEDVPFAAFAQPSGIHRVLPDAITGSPGLFLASDATVDSSPNGAILSGEAAARAAINATHRALGA